MGPISNWCRCEATADVTATAQQPGVLRAQASPQHGPTPHSVQPVPQAEHVQQDQTITYKPVTADGVKAFFSGIKRSSSMARLESQLPPAGVVLPPAPVPQILTKEIEDTKEVNDREDAILARLYKMDDTEFRSKVERVKAHALFSAWVQDKECQEFGGTVEDVCEFQMWLDEQTRALFDSQPLPEQTSASQIDTQPLSHASTVAYTTDDSAVLHPATPLPSASGPVENMATPVQASTLGYISDESNSLGLHASATPAAPLAVTIPAEAPAAPIADAPVSVTIDLSSPTREEVTSAPKQASISAAQTVVESTSREWPDNQLGDPSINSAAAPSPPKALPATPNLEAAEFRPVTAEGAAAFWSILRRKSTDDLSPAPVPPQARQVQTTLPQGDEQAAAVATTAPDNIPSAAAITPCTAHTAATRPEASVAHTCTTETAMHTRTQPEASAAHSPAFAPPAVSAAHSPATATPPGASAAQCLATPPARSPATATPPQAALGPATATPPPEAFATHSPAAATAAPSPATATPPEAFAAHSPAAATAAPSPATATPPQASPAPSPATAPPDMSAPHSPATATPPQAAPGPATATQPHSPAAPTAGPSPATATPPQASPSPATAAALPGGIEGDQAAVDKPTYMRFYRSVRSKKAPPEVTKNFGIGFMTCCWYQTQLKL